MEVTLKPARDGEAERLLGFVRAYYEFDRLPFNHSEAAATLHRLIEDRSLGRAWVIEADAEPTPPPRRSRALVVRLAAMIRLEETRRTRTR